MHSWQGRLINGNNLIPGFVKKILSVVAAFFVMLCLGSIYNWSTFVPELTDHYALSIFQTQVIFGTLIAVYPLTMIVVGKIQKRNNTKLLALLSGLFFGSGYILASFSNGNFYIILLGIGILGGIGTGIGYLLSLTVPIKWFPNHKGTVTGIATAGFGGGAIIMAAFSNWLLNNEIDILRVFLIIGIVFGGVLIVLSQLFSEPDTQTIKPQLTIGQILRQKKFLFLLGGMFSGTFAGLMIIGNLKPIGLLHHIDKTLVMLGIATLSLANFLGRLFWGWLSDKISTLKLIPIALIIMGISTYAIGVFDLQEYLFLTLSFVVGFSFGANFVLFAKETLHEYGIENYGQVYPFIFQGYGIAGLFGATIGGVLYDITDSYTTAVVIAFVLCIAISLVYIVNNKKNKTLMQ